MSRYLQTICKIFYIWNTFIYISSKILNGKKLISYQIILYKYILFFTIGVTYELPVWYGIIRIFRRVTCYAPGKNPFMVTQKWWRKVIDKRSPLIAEEENFGQLRHHRVPVFAEFLYSVRLDNSRKPIRLHNIDVAQSIPSPYARLISLCRERKSFLEKGDGAATKEGLCFGLNFVQNSILRRVWFGRDY